MPNISNAGSKLGISYLGYSKAINRIGAFFSHDICGPYPTNHIIDCLLTVKIVRVVSV